MLSSAKVKVTKSRHVVVIKSFLKHASLICWGRNGAKQSTHKGFSINIFKKPNPQMCEIQSRRGDSFVHGRRQQKIVYDSSAQPGTDLP